MKYLNRDNGILANYCWNILFLAMVAVILQSEGRGTPRMTIVTRDDLGAVRLLMTLEEESILGRVEMKHISSIRGATTMFLNYPETLEEKIQTQ